MRISLAFIVFLLACDSKSESTPVAVNAGDLEPASLAPPLVVEDTEVFVREPPRIPHETRLSLCASSTGCGEKLACNFGTFRCMTADEAEPCKIPCAELGLCIHTPQGCRAETKEHCAESQACRVSGQCTLFEGECAAASDADCEQGAYCALLGHCTASAGTCRAHRDVDCSESCKLHGRCQRLNGTCKVVTDEDCAGPCAFEGRCQQSAARYGRETGLVFDAGWCGWSFVNGSCKGTTVCREEGKCRYRPPRAHSVVGDGCVVTDESCAASARCKADGDCAKISDRECGKPASAPHRKSAKD